MDWLILIFFVPLVLIPLVFLTGFVGCKFHAPITNGGGNGNGSQPTAPSNLVATAINSSKIDLTWTDNAPTNTTSFRITRSENGAPAVDPTTPVNPAPTPGAMSVEWHDSGLNPDTTYEYQVFASVSSQESAGSNLASATTFAIVYNIPVTTPDPGYEASTIVQRIDAAQINNAGAKIILTLRGTAANLVINKVAISQAAVGMQAWDSAADLVEVLFQGASGVTIPGGTAATSDITNYTLVSGEDLVVAFNIGPTNGTAGFAQVQGSKMYSKKNTAEATVQNRSANYVTHQASVYIVEKIEVHA